MAKKSTATKSKKKSTTKPATKKRATSSEPLTHRLDALLHTMRCIAQHEDELCTLLHDARRSGRITAPLRKELHALLSELPAEDYTADLYAVQEELKAA